MKRYDFHSHLGKTRSGDANNADQLVRELGEFGITKVGICSLSGNGMRPQNDLVYEAMCQYPGIVEGYADIDPKAPDAFDEIHRTLGDLRMNGVKFMAWKHGYAVENCPSLGPVIDEIGIRRPHSDSWRSESSVHAVRLDRSCEAETGYEVCIYSCLRERIWVQLHRGDP